MRIAVVVLVSMLFHASHALAQSPEEAVSRALACFADSWNRHDMTSFGQCFADNADFVNVTAQWWKGRHALQKNHAYLHGTIDVSDTTEVTVPPRSHGIFKTSTLTFTSPAMRVARSDLAVARASWQMTGDTRTAEARSGVMMVVVTNDGGVWKSVAVPEHRGRSDRQVAYVAVVDRGMLKAKRIDLVRGPTPRWNGRAFATPLSVHVRHTAKGERIELVMNLCDPVTE